MLRITPISRNSRLAPRALTLVEMLISMAVTLVMMAAVVNLFANIGAGVKTRNASMELGTQLRLARARLFKDLAGATSAVRPKLPSDDHDDGYLEIVEGQWSDRNPSILLDGTDNGDTSANPELDYAASIVPSSNLTLAAGDVTDGGGLGDYDDILALTVRSESEPFTGFGRVFNRTTNLWEDGVIESDLAEIIWYAVENPKSNPSLEAGMRTIYRRVLLLTPGYNGSETVDHDNNPGTPPQTINDPLLSNATLAKLASTRAQYDISLHLDVSNPGNFVLVPNTLSDLTKRENRYAHQPTDFPHRFPFILGTGAAAIAGETNSSVQPFPSTGDRQGEDVMLNDVLAFDLRVYDAGAPILDASGLVVEPSEVGWTLPAPATVNLNPVGFGAYVDLYWNVIDAWNPGTRRSWNTTVNDPQPLFASVPNLKSGLNFSRATPASVTYDTWPYHYENDGIDQDKGRDNNAGVDQGTNGLDDDVTGTVEAYGVDDASERETAPPYDTPLRGMQVKIRVYDRDSRQIREATVTRNFVPQ